MSKRGPSAILALAGLVAFAVLIWLFLRTTGDEPVETAAPESPTISTPRETADEIAAVQPPDSGADEPGPVEPVEQRVAERPQVQAPVADGAQRVEGRVRFPDGTPADERVLVLALDRARKLPELAGSPSLIEMAWNADGQRTNALVATAEVRPDGGFTLELPASDRTAHLALAGRYLFSMASSEVTLPLAEDLVLAGELGAWVTGRLLPPPEPGPLESDFEWIGIELGPDFSAGLDTALRDTIGATRKTEATTDGSFEFRGIPEAGAYGIAIEHGHLAAHLQLGVDPVPGEHLDLDIQMVRGATLRGLVVDDAGTPVSGARVEARHRGVLGDALGALRETATEDDGTFELPNVAVGSLDLLASKEGLRRDRLRLEEELADGAVLGDLTLVLDRGARLEGWVTFPGGVPAEGAEVSAGPDLSQLGGMEAMKIMSTEGGTATTDADGHFVLEGLSASRFEIAVSHSVESGERAGRWRANAKRVQPGDAPLRLELAGLVAMTGRVVDELGDPVTDFSVRSTLSGSGAMFGIGAERLTRGFVEREDGSFTIEALLPELWEVVVDADGYATSTTEEVVLPQSESDPDLVFSLQPAAVVAGTVVDTSDEPVSGARVILDLDLGTRLEAMQNEGIPEVFTDADGRFVMENLNPGNLAFVASLEGFAASEPVACEVASGQVTDGLVLQLRQGGTLTGLVYDDEGDPAVGVMVIVQCAPSYTSQHMLSTDGAGEFVREHLEPGTWQVIATANFMSGDEAPEDLDMGEFLGSMKMSSADIVDGEVTHVVLGAPPADPVSLRGTVVHSSQPVAGAVVSLVPENVQGMSAMSALKMKVTGSDGTFEIRLDKPGSYRLTVQTGLATGQQNNVEYVEHVPEGVDEHEVEIQLPVGRISGRVLGPDGAPLEDCRVTMSVGDGVAFGSLMGGNYVEMTTDADGRYDAHYLRPGSYTVAAGGVALGGMLGGESKGGRSVRSDVRLDEGQWLESIDFRLDEPGELTGKVLAPDGSPVAGAGVFVRDDAGRLLERLSLVTTDAGGRFTYPGVAPGRYRISARTADRASAESAAVSVAAGGTADVNVTLLPGTVLRVVVVDETGAEIRARISVTDAEGHELSGMLSMSDIMEAQNYSSDAQSVGPLADGKYTVTATHEDGRRTARSVRVRGQGERKVKLRL